MADDYRKRAEGSLLNSHGHEAVDYKEQISRAPKVRHLAKRRTKQCRHLGP